MFPTATHAPEHLTLSSTGELGFGVYAPGEPTLTSSPSCPSGLGEEQAQQLWSLLVDDSLSSLHNVASLEQLHQILSETPTLGSLTNRHGMTPLLWAARFSTLDVVERLLPFSNPHAVDDFGDGVLHALSLRFETPFPIPALLGSNKRHRRLIHHLREHLGVSSHAQNHAGQTPLMILLQLHGGLAKRFLKTSPPQVVDREGNNILFYSLFPPSFALSSHHCAFRSLLLPYCDVAQFNRQGESCVSVLIRNELHPHLGVTQLDTLNLFLSVFKTHWGRTHSPGLCEAHLACGLRACLRAISTLHFQRLHQLQEAQGLPLEADALYRFFLFEHPTFELAIGRAVQVVDAVSGHIDDDSCFFSAWEDSWVQELMEWMPCACSRAQRVLLSQCLVAESLGSPPVAPLVESEPLLDAGPMLSFSPLSRPQGSCRRGLMSRKRL